MPASFGSEPASAARRGLTFVLGTSVAVSSIASLRFAQVPLPPAPAFLPAIATATTILYCMTAVIFLAQFKWLRRPCFAVFAAAFLYAGLINAVQTLLAPGIILAGGIGPNSAIAWLWVGWHGGFAFLMLAAVACEAAFPNARLSDQFERPVVYLTGLSVVMLVGIVFVTATGQPDFLPSVNLGSGLGKLRHSAFGIGVLLLDAAALVAVIVVTRCRTLLQLAVAVAILAEMIGAMLMLGAASRSTLGWYVGRVYAAVAAGYVPLLFLLEMDKIYARAATLALALQDLALVDALTNLPNRREFDMRLAAECNAAARRGASIALLMIDVDNFKQFNDHHGHVAGDDTLRRVAQAIQIGVKRTSDLAARYGGEEFAVILPDTDLLAAEPIAEDIRRAVLRLAIPHDASAAGDIVSVSVGVTAIMPKSGFRPVLLTEEADAALYRAKALGRNRVAARTSPPELKLVGPTRA